MNQREMIRARVRGAVPLNATLRRLTLEPASAALFPAWSAGSHILLDMREGERHWRNAYSLVSDPNRRDAYEVIVRRVSPSRGGSVHVHERLHPGQEVLIGAPANLFPLHRQAKRHLLLAGGIGVTPFLSYLRVLEAAGADCALHLCCRAEDRPAFADLLAPWAGRTVITDSAALRAGLGALLAAEPVGTHLYVCGPEGFMAMAQAQATALGWPAGRLHLEHFGGAAPGAPFTVTLARSGRRIEVPAETALLDALEEAGVDAPCLCRGGACGVCLTRVLEGEPEHRDHFLSDEQKASGRYIMPCVSRARTPSLVLDL